MKLRQLMKLIAALKVINLRRFYHLILNSTSTVPSISIENTDHGTFCGFHNDYLFKQAIASGSNEPHFNELVQKILSPSDVALDIGGNIGTHSILLSKILSKGRVYTFEPQSLVFSILQNNLLLNACNNVTAYRFAISSENHRTISMEPFSYVGENINNGGLRVDLNGSMGDYTLTRTLDSFDFEQVDFIKMDIQGSELEALNGSTTLLSKHRPIMFIEIEQQHLNALGASTKHLVERLFSLGYALYRIQTSYPCDHICVPIEKVEYFEESYLNKFSFRCSPRIYGQKVNVSFANENDQNYISLEIF